MPVNVYFVFNGQAEEALQHYQQAFQTEPPEIQRFNDMPGYEKHIPEGYETRIMHGTISIFGSLIMVSDTMPGQEHTIGNNITVAAISNDKASIEHAFNALANEGHIIMELQPTPWSEQYGQLTDKYGIMWQFNHEA